MKFIEKKTILNFSRQLKTVISRLIISGGGLSVIGVLVMAVLLTNTDFVQGQPPFTKARLHPRKLLVGETVERTISGKESDGNHYYVMNLNAGQSFRLLIECDSAPASKFSVNVFDPERKIMFSKLCSEQGKQTIDFSRVAKIGGRYKVNIWSYEKTFYKITLSGGSLTAKEKRAATAATVPAPEDEKRRAAEAKARFLTDRLRPNANGQPLNWANQNDLREIVKRFAEGAEQWHVAGKHAEEHETLQEVAQIYGDLGDLPTALKVAGQALAAARETGKSALEFSALYEIGQLYQRLNEAPHAVEYLNQSLTVLRSAKLRADWRSQYQSGEQADAVAARYKHLQLSRAEIFDRRTAADLSGLETRILMKLATIRRRNGAEMQAAELGAQALAAARRTTGSGIEAFGYGEILKIARRVAQLLVDAGNRTRAEQLIGEEIKRAADNPNFGQLEKDLIELRKLIESGATDLIGDDIW